VELDIHMLEVETGSIYAADDFAPLNPDSPWPWQRAPKTAQHRPRILVVDDEKLIADTITEILEGAGFHVAVAYDGWSALEIAARFHPEYLLSDVLMPRMDGVELAIAFQKICPAARILLISGQVGISEILLSGQKQGFEFELVAKPIHPLKLIERLKE
jgi:CheY-like chemotaxis protein